LSSFHWLLVLLFSITPTVEGRYAIIYGIGIGLDPKHVFIVASITIVLLAVALGALIHYIDSLIIGFKDSRYELFRAVYRFYDRYLLRIRRKARPYIEKYGLIGLIVFVAAPLPGTGVWTGALVSYVFGIDRRRTLLGLSLGGVLSNLIVFILAFFFKVVLWG